MNTVRHIRRQLGLTQAALAQELGVSQSNVAHYERHQTVPPEVARRLIAFAATRGQALSFDDTYGASPAGRALPDAAAAHHDKEQDHA